MTNVRKRPELNLVKKDHRFTHGHKKELVQLFTEEEMMPEKLKQPVEKVKNACIPCAVSGRPANTNKLSLKHVNKRFNVEVQADFLTVKCDEGKYEVLNIVYTSTGYGERAVVESMSSEVMMSKLQEYWICRHGSPKLFSAYPEFCQYFFVKYLNGHVIKVNQRPARLSHKNGRVERSNSTFKSVFEKISKENSKADIELLISTASFVTNIIFGRSKLNSFQLVRGFQPSFPGLPAKTATQDLLDAHIQINACRAIEKAIRSRIPNTITRSMTDKGDKI